MAAAAAGVGSGKIIYEQEGVFIHSSCGKINDQDSLISGILRVLEKDADVIVDWRPLDDTLDSSSILYAGKDSSSVVEWTQTPKERVFRGSEHLNSYEAEWDMVNTVSFKKKPHTNGDAPSHTNGKSKWSFLFSLTDLKSIKQNKEGMGWSYLVFCLKDDVVLPALHFHHGDSKLLIESLEKYVVLCESQQDKRTLLVNCQNKGLSQSFENLLDEPAYGLIQKIKKDPYTATLVGFSKVTNYIFDSLRGNDPSTHQRPPSEMADFLSDAIPGLKINQQEEPGFEVITRIDLGERPVVQRRDPVSLDEWSKNMDSEGRILNVDRMKQMIFRGGLSHVLRKQAWKFLLGYFPWDSTKEERTHLQKLKTDEYFRMKLQWKSVSEEQEKRNSRLRDYRNLIEKDVNRTDRTNKFYEGKDNPGLILLHDILMTYCMYDFDLGYVQGMSDLLSPLLFVMENEVDAFWCFVSYMGQMHINELSMKIDVEDVLCKAEAISIQMAKCKELPQAVCDILGLQNSEVTTPDSDTGEDENVGVISCSTPAFQNNSLPLITTNGTRDDNTRQLGMSQSVSRLTPA
ncbi:TBC1 domain family member 15 isoform X2 [Macrotis lagotis]|uniref:TBC1 domain family member 15 isoform X2 n=1 Tax=Macrotis lagotis TaxID=92651 RepID=UPI003D697CB4